MARTGRPRGGKGKTTTRRTSKTTRDTPGKTTTERGYGQDHRRLRATIQARLDRGEILTCHFCGGPISKRTVWHLDHTPDRNGYRGPAHAHCNTSDGATRGNQQRGGDRKTRWVSRDW